MKRTKTPEEAIAFGRIRRRIITVGTVAATAAAVFPSIVAAAGNRPEAITNPDKFPIFAMPGNPTLNADGGHPTINNRALFALDPTDPTYVQSRDKVRNFGTSQQWGDIIAKPGEWVYALDIMKGDGSVAVDSWVYAFAICQNHDITVYQKPGASSQIWARLPEAKMVGHVALAIAVNPNFINDKTGGDPNTIPSATVRTNVNVPVKAFYMPGDGSPRTLAIGQTEPETGNVMVNLLTDKDGGDTRGYTVIQFPVWTPDTKRTEVMVEPSSDNLTDFVGYNRITPAMGKPW